MNIVKHVYVSVNANYAAECFRNANNLGLCMYVFVGVAAGPFADGGILLHWPHDEGELSLCRQLAAGRCCYLGSARWRCSLLWLVAHAAEPFTNERCSVIGFTYVCTYTSYVCMYVRAGSLRCERLAAGGEVRMAHPCWLDAPGRTRHWEGQAHSFLDRVGARKDLA